jgi:thiamine-phosphate pyrophosphorylase
MILCFLVSFFTKEQKMSSRSIDLTLQLITHRPSLPCYQSFLDRTMAIALNGASLVQLRESRQNEQIALETGLALKKRGIKIIYNNWVDWAIKINADGVHLGPGDFPVQEARKLLPNKIIGYTVKSWRDVVEAQNLDLDYIGVQVFQSPFTKPESTFWGLEDLKKIRLFSRHRIVALGGINLRNLKLVTSGLNVHPKGDGVAMVGALWRSVNPIFSTKMASTILRRAFK